MIIILRELLICSFQMYMFNDLEKNILPYKVRACGKRVVIYAITVLIALFINRMESSLLNLVVIPISYMIASIIIFLGSTWKKIIIAICYYMLATVPEFLFAAITNMYGTVGAIGQFQSEIERTLALLLMNTITFLFIKCINQVTKKRNYINVENKCFSILLILPLATIIILGCVVYSGIPFVGRQKVLLLMGAILLLLTNIFIFTVFDKLIEKSEEAKKMEMLYQKSRIENMNLQYMNKMNLDNKAFLHDVNKFITIVANLIENGDNQELKDIVEHLGVRIQNMNKYNFCSHSVLNSILCERKYIAESKDILFNAKLGGNLKLDFIEDLDLISIVGNLLDNAIEAAERAENNRYVVCKIHIENNDHLLIMEFYNSYIVPPRKEKDQYISTKRESGCHGIGLHTVKKLVEKYAGIMQIEAGDQEFSVKLIFTVK